MASWREIGELACFVSKGGFTKQRENVPARTRSEKNLPQPDISHCEPVSTEGRCAPRPALCPNPLLCEPGLTLTLCTLSTLTLTSLGSDQSAPNQTIEPKQIESMIIWWSRSKKAPRIYIDTRIGLSGPYVPSIISGRLCYVSIEL